MNITFEGDYNEREEKMKSRLKNKDEQLHKFLIKWRLPSLLNDDTPDDVFSQFESELLLKIRELYL